MQGRTLRRSAAGAGLRAGIAALILCAVALPVFVLPVFVLPADAQQDTLGAGGFPLGDPVNAPAASAPAAVPLLVLDEEKLFTQSLWGKRAQSDFAEAAADLQAENRKLETDLAAEEKALSDRRPTMPAEAFRSAADAFDEKVVGIRQAQEAKARALTSRRDSERRAFFAAAVPALRELLRQKGAVAIVDARVVLLSLNAVEATDAAVVVVDRLLGEGQAPDPSSAEDDGAADAADADVSASGGVPPATPSRP
ncbi:OmpH family outer membrane protein [Frigidibacter sp. MR17.14]|uniref:OmpH family outer membrane protein n=1 Tax=Frigidibacter sp. MR17.14 TaxID=3126509 RepID=UPI003012B022